MNRFKNIAIALTYSSNKFLRDSQDEFERWKNSLGLFGIDKKEINRISAYCVIKAHTTKYSSSQLMGLYLDDILMNGKVTNQSQFIFEQNTTPMPNTKKHRIERQMVVRYSQQIAENLKKFEDVVIKPDELTDRDLLNILAYHEMLQEQIHRLSQSVIRLTTNVIQKYECR